jgi:hypothetical protein
MVHQLLKPRSGEGTEMQTQTGMDVLVMAELVRLHRDQTMLEGLYERLPAQPAESNVEARFLSLWSDVEKRANRLEYMLDYMA